MDRFGQIGPEKGDYDDDVLFVASELRGGRTVSVALTHRLTRQQVVVTLKENIVFPGGGPEGTRDGTFAYVGVDEHGAYWFNLEWLVDAGYLASKLSVALPDAETLVDFLARLGRALGLDPSEATARVETLG